MLGATQLDKELTIKSALSIHGHNSVLWGASLVTFRPQPSPISVLMQFCKLLSGSTEIRYCELKLKIPFEPKCSISVN